MSILTDLIPHIKFKCGVCGSRETYFDKRTQSVKWYKTLVKGEAGFWCNRCYKSIHGQMKNDSKTTT